MGVLSDEARAALEQWLAAVRERTASEQPGADPDEVVADLRAHVLTELGVDADAVPTKGALVISAEDVRSVTWAVDGSNELRLPAGLYEAMGKISTAPKPLAMGAFRTLTGILLPFVAVVTELATGTWAEIAFDPLPTPFHAAAILTTSLTCIFASSGLEKRQSHRRWLVPFAGFAFGVALFYGLMTLPFVPIAFLGLLYVGLGVLPLSPYFALMAMVRYRAVLAKEGPLRGWLPAAVAALLLLAGSAFLAFQTRQLVRQAAGSDAALVREAETALRRPWHRLGIRLLSERRTTGGFGRFGPLNDGIAPESLALVRWRLDGVESDLLTAADDWSEGRFGSALAESRRGVTIAAASLDGYVVAEQAAAYLEATLVLANAMREPCEATAVVALPPGASVTRASLWNGGVEVPAAFAPVHKAREAYESVVRRSRDPVLITTYGRDRVLIRCFPVPAGGTMKIRVGFAVPFVPVSPTEAYGELPRILRADFNASALADLRCVLRGEGRLSMTGDSRLTGAGLAAEVRTSYPFDAVGPRIRLVRTDPFPIARESDDLGDPGAEVVQRIRPRIRVARSRTVFALDGAAPLEECRAVVTAAFDGVADGSEVAMVVSDTSGLRTALAPVVCDADVRRRLKDLVAGLLAEGERDDVPLLEAAYALAAEAPDAAVVWFRAGQPARIGNGDRLMLLMRQAPKSPVVWDAPYVLRRGGPCSNALADALSHAPTFKSADDFAAADRAARAVAFAAGSGVETFESVRERVASSVPPSTSRPASRPADGGSLLARLWARDAVDAALQRDQPGDAAAAEKLSTQYGLVTPVVGSVALESEAMMRDQGLVAPVPGRTPRIPVSDLPEPEFYALLGAAVVVVGAAAVRRRRRNGAFA